MLKQNPRTRHLRRLPDGVADCTPSPSPSPTAQARLGDALRDRADAYRADATVDLALVDVLVRMDRLEAAAQTLDDHRASLQAMAEDLQVVVADAAVEREAEHVYDTCLRQLRPDLPVARLRRRLLALSGAAAVAVALLLPANRTLPRTTLASIADRVTHDEVAAARSQLDAARVVADEVRRQPRTVVPVPKALADPAVRKQVRAILAADAPGESAAPLSDDGVPVLARFRAARERAANRPAERRANDEQESARVVPLRVRDSAPGGAADAVVPEEDAEGDDGQAGEAPDGATESGPPALPTD